MQRTSLGTRILVLLINEHTCMALNYTVMITNMSVSLVDFWVHLDSVAQGMAKILGFEE